MTLMWNLLFGWMLGSTVRNTGLPEDVKVSRYEGRQQRKADKRAVRAQPTNWYVVVAFGLVCVVVLLLAR